MLFGEDISSPLPRAEIIMQKGSVIRRTRKKHSDISQFRWWEPFAALCVTTQALA
jgi:hypothetical protein